MLHFSNHYSSRVCLSGDCKMLSIGVHAESWLQGQSCLSEMQASRVVRWTEAKRGPGALEAQHAGFEISQLVASKLTSMLTGMQNIGCAHHLAPKVIIKLIWKVMEPPHSSMCMGARLMLQL